MIKNSCEFSLHFKTTLIFLQPWIELIHVDLIQPEKATFRPVKVDQSCVFELFDSLSKRETMK